MKTRTILLATATIFFMAIFPTITKAQNPFKNLTENYPAATIQTLIGLDNEVRGEVTFSLPQKGKDIDVFYSDGTQKKLVWK